MGPLAEVLQHLAPTTGCVPNARAPEEMVLLLLMVVGIIYAVDMDDANTPRGVLRERGGKFGARISNLQAVPLCRIAAPFFFLKFSAFRA